MKLKIKRKLGNAKFTEGKMYTDGEFECFTIEDAVRLGEKVYSKTAIPKGIYEIVMSMSTRFKKVLPEILNVPGFTGVRIHTGNTSADTEGCIIIGAVNDSIDDDFVGSSKVAAQRLFPKIQSAINAGQKVTLEVG